MGRFRVVVKGSQVLRGYIGVDDFEGSGEVMSAETAVDVENVVSSLYISRILVFFSAKSYLVDTRYLSLTWDLLASHRDSIDYSCRFRGWVLLFSISPSQNFEVL